MCTWPMVKSGVIKKNYNNYKVLVMEKFNVCSKYKNVPRTTYDFISI